LNNNKFKSTSSQHPYQSHIPNLMISLISYVKSTTTLIPSSTSSSSLSLPSPSLPLHPQMSSRIPSLIYWSQGKGIEITREDWEESLFKFTVEWDLIGSSVSSPPPTTKTKRKITAAAPTSTTTTTSTTVDGSSAVLSGNDDDEESTVHEREEERGDEKIKRFDKEKEDEDDKVVLPAVVKIGLPIPAASSSANQGRDGWDIKITSSSSSTLDSSETVTTTTTDKGSSYTISLETLKNDPLNLTTRYVLKISHHHHHQKDSSSSSSEKTQGLERYKLVINRLVGGKGVRLNGNLLPVKIIQREGEKKEDDYDHDHVDESRQEGEEEDEKGWKRLLKRSFELEREYRDNHRNDSAISIRTTSSSTTTTTTTTTTTKQQHEISLLLRRSYIYFLSLLQEPPAKWKLIQDNSSSRGVTITQLVSPDPTLTIFKAEAVFVGVGVWDVFASVLSSWGTSNSNSWDKGIEESRLISSNTGNVGEKLSEVWWEKRKGNWPIAYVILLFVSIRHVNHLLIER